MSAMKHSASAASMDSMGSNRGMGASGSSFKLREAEEEDQGFTSRHLRRYAKFAYTWPWCLSVGIVAFTLLLTIIVGVTGVALTDESDYAWFILKSTRVARMDAFLEATDRLGDNFEPPERSDPKMRWGYYITYKAHDGDMLTPANLDVVRKTETMLADLNGEYFKEWCLLTYDANGGTECVMPNTWATQLGDGELTQADIDAKKVELYGTEQGKFMFDRDFDGTAMGKAEYIRSLWYFASPLNKVTYGDDAADWEADVMDFHVKVDEGMQELYGIKAAWALASVYTETAKMGQVETAWFSEPLVNNEFANTVNGDFLWAVFCIIAVWCYMAIHTQSLLLASVGMYEIIIAFPIAFFFYKIVFGVKYFQTLQILSVFVMLGIGADDVFVFVDAFKQASTQVGSDPEERLAFACARASRAIFATSLTTAGAFAATIASRVMPIASFGIFACLLISMLYLINIALLPPVLVLWSRNFGHLPCCVCCGCCHEALQTTVCKPKEVDEAAEEGKDEGEKATRWLERFFNTTFSDFVIYSNARYAIMAVFTGIFVLGIVFSIQLEPPEEQEPWFSNSHMFTKLDNWNKDNFGASSDDQAASINLMWGVKGMDHKGVDFFDAEQRGKLVWDDTFDLADPDAQRHLLEFCPALRVGECNTKICRDNLLVRNGEVKCVLEGFDEWLQELDPPMSLPVADRAEFLAKLLEYSQRTQTQALYSSQIGFIAVDGACVGERCTKLDGVDMELKYLFYSANSTFKPPVAFKRVNPTYNEWEGFMVEYNEGAPASAAHGIQMSLVWMFAETQEALVQTVVQGMSITFALSFVVLLFATGNVILALLSIVTIAGIVTSVLGIGCRLIQGWSLDIPESVAGVILIGFSVDYCVHLAHAYMESAATSRQERVQDAVTCMGISITAGAATTFMAGVFLFGAVLPFFQKFGFIIVFTIFCSYLWAVLFFVAACATLGPDGDTGNLAVMYASAKRMVTGQKQADTAEARTEEAGVNGNALSVE